MTAKKTKLVPVAAQTEPVPGAELRDRAVRIMTGARASLQTTAEVTRAAAARTGEGLARASGAVGRAAGSTAAAAGKLGHAAAHAVGDLNGDGKIDEEDFRIARDAAARAASVAGREAGELGKAVLRHEITKDAAAGAAVGALIAVPIPLVGPVAGAAVGGAIGLTRGLLDSGVLADAAGEIADAIRTPKKRKPAAPRKKATS